ncbi:MAG TPA: cytoplasmic protein [Anaerolineales bacterium]|nr:cytoplasmic protein [Anaerolineales bacterium]
MGSNNDEEKDADIIKAHKHSSHHRAEVIESEICGCFHCLEMFPPEDIEEWWDEGESGIGQTAVCPRCGIDSVIGSRACFPLTKTFLIRMHDYWF